MTEDLKRSFWTDTARAGLVMGLLIGVFDIAMLVLGAQELYASLKFTYYIVVMGSVLVIYTRQRGLKYGNDGLSYGKALGFMSVIGMFSGLIMGVGMFFMMNYIAPDYYRELLERSMLIVRPDMTATEQAEGLALSLKLIKNPLFSLLAGVMNMMLYSMFVGLIAAVFAKREPWAKPF